jgi:hypothetical protein
MFTAILLVIQPDVLQMILVSENTGAYPTMQQLDGDQRPWSMLTKES